MRKARTPLARRLVRGLRLARLALGWETLWPRLWPALGVVGLFLLAAWSGLFLHVPPWLHLVLLAGFALALGGAFWRGFRGFAWPGNAAAERRLETASGLRHRPLSTLREQALSEDPATLALWRAHQMRAVAGLRRLRVGAPRPNLAARDPRALRTGLLVALCAALVFAGGEAGERLRRALWPSLHAAPLGAALKLEAWVTPPAYTGAAPVFLDLAGGVLAVPQGSTLQVALSGGSGGVPELRVDERATPLRTLDAGSFALETPLTRGARVALRRDGRELVAWSFSVQADAPPTAAFTEPPGPSPRGLSVRLPWRADDDWGIAAAQAEIRLAARPHAEPILLDLPLAGGEPRARKGVSQPDLSAHPWAGLPVRVRILARDGAGQQGSSETQELVLPERQFTHPVARTLVELRKSLSLDPLGRDGVRRGLDDLAARPEAFEHDIATFLALRVARFQLMRDRRPEAVDDVQKLMWDAAVALEEGRADRTARALAEAREALREALAEAERAPADAANRAELERRVQELRDAVQRHLEALLERMREQGMEPAPLDPNQQAMNQQELERRMQEMQESARQGRTEQLQQELAQLEQMLEALQQGRVAARPEGGRNNSQRQQQQQRGEQQMGAVQDMVQRQGQLLDRSHQREPAREQPAERRPGTPYGRPQPGQQPSRQPQASDRAGEEAQRDGRTQRALRRALGELMQQFGDLTGEVPEALGRADQAMRQAQEALGQGRDASGHQQDAIRELQEGGRQMAQSMQQQFGQGQGDGQGNGQGDPGAAMGAQGQDRMAGQGQGRDPLGRPTREAPGSSDQGSDTQVPEEAEMLRSRRIQEELRRRGAERERPPSELDYIDRLLKPY